MDDIKRIIENMPQHAKSTCTAMVLGRLWRRGCFCQQKNTVYEICENHPILKTNATTSPTKKHRGEFAFVPNDTVVLIGCNV